MRERARALVTSTRMYVNESAEFVGGAGLLTVSGIERVVAIWRIG